jgi:hypothetical protein
MGILNSRSTVNPCNDQIRNGSTGTYHFKYHAYHQTTAGTHSDVFLVPQVGDGDLEAVAARARVMVDFKGRIVGHILDLYLVVNVLGHLGSWECESGMLGA